MNLSLYEMYKDLRAKGILLCYSGPMNQASLEAIGMTLRRNLEIAEVANTTRFSVFSIFVEQVQNVLNYSNERLTDSVQDDNALSVGVVVIGHEENGDYFVCCGNRVFTKDVQRISASIESVNGLDKGDLKALYKERRKGDSSSDSKGAGLGLIEMARKSSRSFEYSFVKVSHEFSFFSIKVVVGSKENG